MSAPTPSCAALARQLPALWDQQEALDLASRRFAQGTPELYAAERRQADIEARIWATEDLVLATPATGLADATALIILSIHKVVTGITCENAQDDLEQAERALVSALRVVARAAGVTPEEMGAASCLRLRDLPAAEPGGAA